MLLNHVRHQDPHWSPQARAASAELSMRAASLLILTGRWPAGSIVTHAQSAGMPEPIRNLVGVEKTGAFRYKWVDKRLTKTEMRLEQTSYHKAAAVDFSSGAAQSVAAHQEPMPPEPRPAQPGRPRIGNRAVLNGIWYILWTGCQWKAVHRDWFGVSSSVLHERFQTWQETGVWDKVFQTLVKFYRRERRIQWRWQAVDSRSCAAPLGGRKPAKTQPIAPIGLQNPHFGRSTGGAAGYRHQWRQSTRQVVGQEFGVPCCGKAPGFRAAFLR